MKEHRLSERVSFLRGSLPLTRSLPFLPGDGLRREIALVALKDRCSNLYYGEIAPLPGFSVESLEDALYELDTISYAFPPLEAANLPLPPVWTTFLRTIHCPSLRCGIEGALLDRLARGDTSSRDLFRQSSIECNALIMARDERELREEVERTVANGFRTLKIKISPGTIKSTVRTLRDTLLPAGTRLRLDANRSFSLPEWGAVTDELTSLPIEYIEEPLSSPEHLPSLIQSKRLPIALDETTRDTPPEEWLRWGARAVVLKPSLNGGLLSLLPLISLIERGGAYVTLSSSFESGVGLRAITLLAAMMNQCGAIGVDTATILAHDLSEPPFPRSLPDILVHQLAHARVVGGVE